MLDSFAHGLVGLALVHVRVLLCLMLSPVLSERTIPNSIKVLLLVAMIGCIALGDLGLPQTYDFYCVLNEIIVGLFLGFLLRGAFIVLQLVGTIVAQCVSISQLFGNNMTEHMPAISQFFTYGGTMLLLLGGYFPLLISYLFDSYSSMPMCVAKNHGDILNWALEEFSGLFAFAVVLSMPFVIMSLLYNIMLGVINRAIPQMMVAMVGAPLITFLGIFGLMMTIGFILNLWSQRFYEVISL